MGWAPMYSNGVMRLEKSLKRPTIRPMSPHNARLGAIVKSGVRRVDHAAALLSSLSSMPSLNLTPSMTFPKAGGRDDACRTSGKRLTVPVFRGAEQARCPSRYLAGRSFQTRNRARISHGEPRARARDCALGWPGTG